MFQISNQAGENGVQAIIDAAKHMKSQLLESDFDCISLYGGTFEFIGQHILHFAVLPQLGALFVAFGDVILVQHGRSRSFSFYDLILHLSNGFVNKILDVHLIFFISILSRASNVDSYGCGIPLLLDIKRQKR
jgi:hypothetical protein